MNTCYRGNEKWKALREKIIGLGDHSTRKSFYPQLQQRLRELEKFRTILDLTDEGIIALEIPSGLFIDINSAAHNHLDLEREESIDLSIFSLNTPLAEKIADFINSDSGSEVIEIVKSTDNYYATVIEANLKKNNVNGESFVLVFTRDISRQKHLENEKETLLIISRMFLESNSLEAIYRQLPLLMNERLSFPVVSIDIFDIEKNTVKRYCLSDIGVDIGTRLPGNENTIQEKVFETGNPFISGNAGESDLIKQSFSGIGDINTIICIPMKLAKQTTSVLTLADFCRRKEIDSLFQTIQVIANHLTLEIRRKDTEEKLVKRNKDLNDFAGGVSHNLRNSLSIIGGYVELCCSNPEYLQENKNKIIKQIKKLSGFVDNVLELSRAGLNIHDKISVNLDKLVRNIFLIQKENIPSQLLIESPLPRVIADQESMRQVFANLISNAFKYRDTNKDELLIEIAHHFNGNGLAIEFQDNGIGIEKNKIRKVFDIGVSGKPGEYSGFGLSIVKKVAEAHGGSVWAESEGGGKGTRFNIILPDIVSPDRSILSE